MYFPKYRNFDTGNFSLALSIYRYIDFGQSVGPDLGPNFVQR